MKDEAQETLEESGYRTKPYVPPEEPESVGLHEGPRFKCPGCGMPGTERTEKRAGGKKPETFLVIEVNAVHGPLLPTACSSRRCWWWPFGCRETAVHLHQRCGSCGSKWIVGPVEEA